MIGWRQAENRGEVCAWFEDDAVSADEWWLSLPPWGTIQCKGPDRDTTGFDDAFGVVFNGWEAT